MSLMFFILKCQRFQAKPAFFLNEKAGFVCFVYEVESRLRNGGKAFNKPSTRKRNVLCLRRYVLVGEM